MLRFLIRRTLFAILVLLIISFVVFYIFYVVNNETPTQRATQFAGRGATPQSIAAVVQRLGLAKPWYDQFGHYLNRLVLHGDLGTDFSTSASVNSELLSRLPITASLAIGSAVLWLLIGVPFGILAATKPRSIRDRLATVFSLTFYSIPTFVLGLLLLLVFYYLLTLKAGLHWFPFGGYVPLTENPWEWFHHLILPWFTLALVYAASYSRVTRSSMLDVLGEDYIRTARAKGLSERRVVYRHALRSALTPIVTILGIDLGGLLGGAIITEVIFTLNGIGEFSIRAVNNGDLPVISATVLVAAGFVIIANLVVDILYAVLDPRVRLS